MASSKVAHRQKAAEFDIDTAADWYAGGGVGVEVAERFADAIEVVLNQIAERPGVGSRRHADLLTEANLRHRAVRGFPYLMFYVEHEEHIEVWRVLHTSRDIPPLLS